MKKETIFSVNSYLKTAIEYVGYAISTLRYSDDNDRETAKEQLELALKLMKLQNKIEENKIKEDE